MAVDSKLSLSKEVEAVLYVTKNVQDIKNLIKSSRESDLRELEIIRMVNDMGNPFSQNIQEEINEHIERLESRLKGNTLLNEDLSFWEGCLSKLPKLCDHCNGKRFINHSVSGQMAQRCSSCWGTGLQRRGK